MLIIFCNEIFNTYVIDINLQNILLLQVQIKKIVNRDFLHII